MKVTEVLFEEKSLLARAKLVVENPLASDAAISEETLNSEVSRTRSPLFMLSDALHDRLMEAL